LCAVDIIGSLCSPISAVSYDGLEEWDTIPSRIRAHFSGHFVQIGSGPFQAACSVDSRVFFCMGLGMVVHMWFGSGPGSDGCNEM
jgi:hypothetical protein